MSSTSSPSRTATESTIRVHVRPKFGDKSVALITLDQVRKYVEKIEEDGFPGAARSVCSAMKAIMAFACTLLTPQG